MEKTSLPPFNVACLFCKTTAIVAQHCLGGGGGGLNGPRGEKEGKKGSQGQIIGLKR